MEKTWIIVADSARARFFQVERPIGPIREVRDIVNPEARLHERELVTDSPGRTHQNQAGPARRQTFDEGSAKEHETRLFAREIIEEAEKLRGRGELQKLHVLAEPGFLGRLREHYSDPLKRCIGEEITNRATERRPEEIRELLPFRM
jgi:protein required for attachment to host cells